MSTMHNPKMYEKYISFQKRDAQYALDKFGDRMNWRENSSVIDLGSGDGYVTTRILKSYLPERFDKIVGIDASKEMVDFANKQYGDEKISFDVMDLGKRLPEKYRGFFDHAFSSYALQFVFDQKQAFQNIHDVLKENGSCIVLFTPSIPLIDAMIKLSRTEKWSKYVDQSNFFPIYPKDNTQIEIELRKLMADSGFKTIEVEVQPTAYEYACIEDLLNMVKSANLMHLPEGPILDEFIEEFRQTVQVTKVDDHSKAVRLSYIRTVVFGRK